MTTLVIMFSRSLSQIILQFKYLCLFQRLKVWTINEKKGKREPSCDTNHIRGTKNNSSQRRRKIENRS